MKLPPNERRQPTTPPAPSRALGVLLAGAALGGSASAQITLSIDWKSQSVARPDSSSAPRPITEGDLLVPGAPPTLGNMPAPIVRVLGSELQLVNYQGCVGHAAGTPCEIEVDALSSGFDDEFRPNQTPLTGGGGRGEPEGPGAPIRRRIWYSVDEWASGNQLTPQSPLHPSVFNQGNPTLPPTSPGVFEACADVFVDVNLPSPPIGPGFSPRNSAGALDGNGLPSANGFAYFGLGLLEPRPTNQPFPYPGDNLDALEIGTDMSSVPAIYFSLDSAFFDRLSGVNNTGSAQANGFVGGDVLKAVPATGQVLRFASALQLGLDQLVPDSDDLDALLLADNGDGLYQPSLVPYDWLNGSTDMLVFSVRRGSAIVNQLDSIFGAPIQPGDLLVPPVTGGLNQNPGIFVAAEALGLRTFRGIAGQHGDDLDALDLTKEPCFDCNENGVDDSVDIANGASLDSNLNGIPDECEDLVVEFCNCPLGSSATCSNSYAAGGCRNSTGVGGQLLSNISSGGSVSVAADNLVLSASQLPLSVSGMFYMGGASKPANRFYDGLRCIDLPLRRYATQSTGPSGTMLLGPGLAALSAARFGPSGAITAGSTWFFQTWYRDPTGPCGKNANVTNVVKVTFTP